MWNLILCVCLVTQSCLTRWDPVDCSPPGSSVHGDSPGKNTGVGCHALLQGIFLTQGLNSYVSCIGRWVLCKCFFPQQFISSREAPLGVKKIIKRVKWLETFFSFPLFPSSFLLLCPSPSLPFEVYIAPINWLSTMEMRLGLIFPISFSSSFTFQFSLVILASLC